MEKKSKTFYCDAYIFKTDDGLKGNLPVYKTAGAACADVAVPSGEDIMIKPHETKKIDLMLMFDIPDGYKVVMYPRSSLLVKKGLMSPVSIIDSDYKGRVHFPVHNLTDDHVTLVSSERVAQIECVPCGPRPDNWLQENGERDQTGFGGSGTV